MSNIPERHPRDGVENWADTNDIDGLERRVCPNCRNYFDCGENSDKVFCSKACEKRHERGEYV